MVNFLFLDEIDLADFTRAVRHFIMHIASRMLCDSFTLASFQ